MLRFALSIGLAVLLFSSGNASALTISNLSSGAPPVVVDPPSLQELLDDLVVSGPPIDANAASGAQLFNYSESPVTTQLVFSFGDVGERLAFGIYDAGNPNNKAFLLTDAFDATDTVTISFSTDGSISIGGGAGTQQRYRGFDGPFGFFVKTRSPGSNPVFLYSENDLNGGAQQMKAFQGNGETTLQYPGVDPALFLADQYLLAWETGTGENNDGDFNDFIVSVSAVTAVPEPGAAALLGLAVVALARMRRVRLY